MALRHARCELASAFETWHQSNTVAVCGQVKSKPSDSGLVRPHLCVLGRKLGLLCPAQGLVPPLRDGLQRELHALGTRTPLAPLFHHLLELQHASSVVQCGIFRELARAFAAASLRHHHWQQLVVRSPGSLVPLPQLFPNLRSFITVRLANARGQTDLQSMFCSRAKSTANKDQPAAERPQHENCTYIKPCSRAEWVPGDQKRSGDVSAPALQDLASSVVQQEWAHGQAWAASQISCSVQGAACGCRGPCEPPKSLSDEARVAGLFGSAKSIEEETNPAVHEELQSHQLPPKFDVGRAGQGRCNGYSKIYGNSLSTANRGQSQLPTSRCSDQLAGWQLVPVALSQPCHKIPCSTQPFRRGSPRLPHLPVFRECEARAPAPARPPVGSPGRLPGSESWPAPPARQGRRSTSAEACLALSNGQGSLLRGGGVAGPCPTPASNRRGRWESKGLQKMAFS